MKSKNVVVGAGFAGSVIARELADKGEDVLVIEKHAHVGGHAHDAYNEHGILIHTYGPHIFHTNDKAVWDWLSRFTRWHHYQHRVLAYVDGMLVPMPISADTVNALYNLSLSSDEVGAWLASKAIDIPDPANSEEVVLSKAGRDIYEKFFKNYTLKQWERSAAELDPSVISRIPMRANRDTRYFSDRYQGLPDRGYTAMFERILDHPRIMRLMNADWLAVRASIQWERLFFTGPIDAYFDWAKGRLGYRSVRFEYETYFDREWYQDVGTVNYPNDYDFTRVTEYKRLTGQRLPWTTIAREYSQAEGEPFYVIPDEPNRKMAAAYAELASKERGVSFVGRLAEYRYYNMDAVVARALAVAGGA